MAQIAARQWGVVTDAQLLACGLSRASIWRWVQAGRLHRLHPGVYAVGHVALSRVGHLAAALFYAGRGAALSHTTATAWWQLTPRWPDKIHVSTARRRRPRPGVALHRPRSLEHVLYRRLAVTPVARTLLDFAATASVEEVRKALARADYRRRLEPEALAAVMGRGHPGSARLRAAYEAHLPQLAETLSPLEDEFLFLCEREGLPLPEVNPWIGPYRVDALWREARVIVELDGRSAHGTPAQRLADHERDMKLRGLGYTVRRYSWYQVFHAPRTVAADLRNARATHEPGLGGRA